MGKITLNIFTFIFELLLIFNPSLKVFVNLRIVGHSKEGPRAVGREVLTVGSPTWILDNEVKERCFVIG